MNSRFRRFAALLGISESSNTSSRRPPSVLSVESLEDRIYLSAADPIPRAVPPSESDVLHAPAGEEDVGPVVPRHPRTSAGPGVILDLGGGLVAFLTNEAAQKRDLNGDGDKLDDVLQAFDANLGVVRNSAQQAIADSLVDLGDGLVAFLTDEAAQGRVLNNDRDKLDEVLQVFNAVTGVVRNSHQQAIADSILDLEVGGVAFLTSEAAQRRVLNGDRDKLDNVLQVFDPVANVVRNSRQQAVSGSLVDLENGIIVFLTDEAAQGRRLNGDGDKLDQVLQAFDAVTGVVRNSGAQAVAGSLLDLGSGFVAFTTSEAEQGRRLNGDGDKQDSVLQVFDAVLGVVQNTGQAVA